MNSITLVIACLGALCVAVSLVMTAWLFFVAGVQWGIQAGARAARLADDQEADVVYIYEARSPFERDRDGGAA